MMWQQAQCRNATEGHLKNQTNKTPCNSINKITISHYTMLKDAVPGAPPLPPHLPRRVNLQSLILSFKETLLPYALSM